MKTVRIWFQKRGTARYISHLDLNRCMTRAVRRAKIPLWYTQGFRPHAFLTFALPLSLGVAGERESMDIKLSSEGMLSSESMEPAEIVRRMNGALPEDLPVFAATDPVMKPGKIAWASYRMLMDPEGDAPEESALRITELFQRPEILVSRHTKKGMAEMNLSPYLDRVSIAAKDGKILLEAVLPAGSELNINPFLLTDALRTCLKLDYFTETVRTNLYDKDMAEFA